MTLEELKALNIEDAAANKIFNNFTALNQQISTLTQQIADRDKSISELNKNVKNIDDLNETIKTLKEDIETKDKLYTDQLIKDRKLFAIKESLLSDSKYRPHDVDLVISQFDMESIPYDKKENKPDISYIDTKKNELIEKKSFLFNSVSDTGKNNQQQPFKVVSPKLEYGKTVPNKQTGVNEAVMNFAKKMAEDNLKARGIKKDKQN